nr:uncharacterized protein LOC127315399 [Lolium perenne]
MEPTHGSDPKSIEVELTGIEGLREAAENKSSESHASSRPAPLQDSLLLLPALSLQLSHTPSPSSPSPKSPSPFTPHAAARSLIFALQPEDILVLDAVRSGAYRGRPSRTRHGGEDGDQHGWEVWARPRVMRRLHLHGASWTGSVQPSWMGSAPCSAQP